MKASEYIRRKPVNIVNQEWSTNGTVTVSIFKESWKRPYKFTAKNFGMKNEEILADEEVTEEI